MLCNSCAAVADLLRGVRSRGGTSKRCCVNSAHTASLVWTSVRYNFVFAVHFKQCDDSYTEEFHQLKMSHNWTEEQTLMLIDLVRDFPNIWNPENETYKNKNKRTDAFNDIAEAVGFSREECERKWKVVQNQFRRECVKSVTKSGQGTSELYVSHWFGYKHLMFLKDRNKPRHTRDTEVEVSKHYVLLPVHRIIIIILKLAQTILFFIPFCLATALFHW